MIYGFDTTNEDAAAAALVVYGIYRSRDPKKLKVTPKFWGTIEKAVKGTAKRALSLPVWIDKLKPKLGCDSIVPKWVATGAENLITMKQSASGELMSISPKETKSFLTQVIETHEQDKVLDVAYRQTAYVIMLVRDRLEREKPYEGLAEEAKVDGEE